MRSILIIAIIMIALAAPAMATYYGESGYYNDATPSTVNVSSLQIVGLKGTNVGPWNFSTVYEFLNVTAPYGYLHEAHDGSSGETADWINFTSTGTWRNGTTYDAFADYIAPNLYYIRASWMRINTTPLAANYTVTINPDPVGSGNTISIKADSSLGWANVNAYSLNFDFYDEFEVNGHEPTWIKKADNHWYQYNEDTGAYDVDWGLSFPETVTGTIETPGTYTLEAAFWEVTGGGGKAYDTVTVIGAGVLIPITFITKDYTSSSTVAPSTISVHNLGNSTWSNQTTATGSRVVNVISGQYYQWTGSATGYSESVPMSYKFTGARTVEINLYKTLTVAAGNNTCYVQVSDDDLNPLSGAAVLLSDGQYKTTGESGVVTFTVLEGATYQIDVSKSGYVSQTRTVQVVGTSNGFSFELSKRYVTTVPTTAPGEAPTIDTRTDTEKDQEMMDIIRTSGPDLIQLAILVTIITMVGWIGSGKR